MFNLIAAAIVSVASLQHNDARVDFDLQTGTYNLTTGQTRAITNAHAAVEGWSSNDSGYQRRITSKSRNQLSIECARPDAPTLLLEFTLHPRFVELRTGLKNTTPQPIRIRKFWPLTGGVVFPGENWTDVRTLDAPSSVHLPRVTGDAVRSSANNLLLTFKQSGTRRSLVLGALKTADFTKWAHIQAGHTASVEAYDPVGRLVDPGETYLPADSFYVDAGTANPFEALEQYGQALRQATGATKLNPYDFPTVCAWYAGVWKTPGAQNYPGKSAYKINTTTGLVEEAEKMRASGFLNYSRAAGRLVPDSYTPTNPQGWWDDAHWQKHGYYTAPFETSEKFGDGMHRLGALAFLYIQPVIQPPAYKNRICKDFRDTHPDLLLKSSWHQGLDYSKPAAQDYIRARFGAMRGHIDGLMVDYADQVWFSLLYGHSPEPRLASSTYENITDTDTPAEADESLRMSAVASNEDIAFDNKSPVVLADRKMTATGFYRKFFSLLREGLGPHARIHERNLEQPNNDLTLGIVDSQRTALDSNKISPALIARSALRWYKNRVVLAYDMDSKDITSAWLPKQSGLEKNEGFDGWSGTDQEGRRMTLTMAYVAASRLLLANSFRDMSAAMLHDLTRTFPYPTEPRSARPIDAFTNPGFPRVYDFAVTPDWHQVTLFNNTLPTREETIAVPLAGDTTDGAFGLDPRHEYYVYDFWNDCFVGKFKGSDTLRQVLRPGEARMLSIRKVEKHPQVLSTNRHIMQGYYELSDVKWSGHRLTGKAKVVAGDPLKIVIALNGHQPKDVKVSDDGRLAVLTIERSKNETVSWSVSFKKEEHQRPKEMP
jgi:hypothetical protein